MSVVALIPEQAQTPLRHPRALLFGKIPGQGDFVHRGIEEDRVTVWEAWATGAIDYARAKLADRYEDLHDKAAPWCFIGGPGTLGPGWRIGVLAPSADRAGRRFVTVLALEEVPFPIVVTNAGSLLQQLIEALYKIFDDALPIEEAYLLVSGCGLQADGAQVLAADFLLQPRADGVWWPHVEDIAAEDFLPGADPSPDLIYRVLTTRSGDCPP